MTEKTLRDEFAMAALAFLCAPEDEVTNFEAARLAYKIADAMMMVREEKNAMTITHTQADIELAPHLDANIGRNLGILADYIQQHKDYTVLMEKTP